MKYNYLALVLFTLFSVLGHSQKKQLNIKRTSNPPKIDGFLNDSIWQGLQVATNFTQFRPNMGVKDSVEIETIAKITYDDEAIYVGAFLRDDPSKIMKQFRSRDNFGESDFFAIILNPNNDSQNDTQFFIFSSGNQADALATPSNGEDFSWNAVWESKVQILENGWSLEAKIPYRTLRFSNKEIQTWGVQFHRRFERDKSQYTWNPIDVTKGSRSLYHGEVTGITNIKPPLRLILYPFTSTVFDSNNSPNLNLGMDVKYGISESFTLDATLIPDFSQVGFDNLVLNLGPFEQVFNEQRQFFTEGVELFNKGNLFFSRRIGSAPTKRVDLQENEEIDEYPNSVDLLNAIKISGRTKDGWGIGFLNAITKKTNTSINTINDSGEVISQRSELVEPTTNYNVLVVDKQFNKNSSVSVVNTSVLREGNFRDANVTGLLADINNKKNSFNLEAQAKMSSINNLSTTINGYSSFLALRKTNGKFRASFDHSYADENYDINDLGLLFRNNFNNFGVDLSYRIFQPTKRLNSYQIFSWANYNRLVNPNEFSGFDFGAAYFATTKKLLFYGGNIGFAPGSQYDYFEPRQSGKFFLFENRFFTNFQIATNRNKKLSIEIIPEYIKFFGEQRKTSTYGIMLIPSARPTTKLSLSVRSRLRYSKNDLGFASIIEDNSVFGDRDRFTFENVFSATYNFNELHFANINFRHNWDKVTYNELFVLGNNGRVMTDSEISLDQIESNPNINFSTWNFDLNYSWQFAPGSFLTVLYRNQAFNRTNLSSANFSESLDDLFNQELQHIFSIRLQYFFDVNSLLK